MNEQRKWFLEIKSTPGEDAVQIVEMTTKDLEQYINLVDKAAAGFERIESNSERRSTTCKMLSNGIAHYGETVLERKSQSMPQISLLSYFATSAFSTTLTGLQPSRQDSPTAKRL